MSAPTVSVVIPCYRAETTLERALNSVRAQTQPALEVIVVDDASGAETAMAIARIHRELSGDGKLRVLTHDCNRGAAAARNTGWAAARGDFVAFLDADDAWHPQKLAIQRRYLEENPDVVICGHTHVRLRVGEPWPQLPPHWAATDLSLRALLLSNRFVTPSVMVRKNAPWRFLDGQRHMEDHLLWMRIAAQGHRVVRLEVPLVALFKPQYGASGLSGQVISMARADVANYWRLHREGAIGAVLAALLSGMAAGKFVRRLLMLGLRRLGQSFAMRGVEPQSGSKSLRP